MANKPETLLRLLRLGVADDNAQQEAAEFLAATLSAKNGHDGDEDNHESDFSIERFHKLAEEHGELTRRCTLLEQEADDVPRQLRETAREAANMAYAEVASMVENEDGGEPGPDLPRRIRALAKGGKGSVVFSEEDDEDDDEV